MATQLIDQLNRFLALQDLVEGLGICWATFGLKFPILLNWVRLRPGIWDGGAISSTDWGATSAPMWGCLGFAPNRWSKQCGMDILPIFLLRLGSSLLIWMASLASHVIWEGSLSMMLKSVMEGKGWWKSLQHLSMAKVVDLECSLTLSPRAQIQEHSSTRHHQKEVGHQLVQQAPQWWRTISSTEGPKFAVSSSKVPLTEYIAVTKRICNELSENTAGRDCTEIYQKTK